MLGHATGGEVWLVVADRAEDEDVIAVVAHPGVEDFQNRQLLLGVEIDKRFEHLSQDGLPEARAIAVWKCMLTGSSA